MQGQSLRLYLFTDPIVIIGTLLLGAVATFICLFDRSRRWQHPLFRWWGRMVLWAGRVKVRTEGLVRLDPRGAYVFAANHHSFADTPLLAATLPTPFRFLAKESLFRVPFIGWYMRAAGFLPVVRGNARASLRCLTDAARVIRQYGISVLVFPEGERSRGPLEEFKDGAAYIAIKAGVPLVPVAINGTAEIIPIGQLQIRSGKVGLRAGNPIPTQGMRIQDHEKLTRRLYNEVADLMGGAGSRSGGSWTR